MTRLPLRLFGFAALISVFGLGLHARDDAPKAEKAKPTTVKVERGTIKTDVSVKGVFEASEMVEVSIKPEVWSAFPVLKAVDAGTKVKTGDVLIEFDPERIDKAIRDLESEQKLAELTLKMAEIDLPLAEKSNPLELASAERAYKHAREDFEKFLNLDKKQSEENVEFGVKNAQSNLDNQKEELKQLEKMYRSKDLTEETEEIILKRQRFAVESAEFFLKSSKLRRDQVVNIDLPRREKEMRDGVERAEISLAKARNSIPMSLDQKRLALAKAKYERARAVEKFDNLKKDRSLFTVKSPADGVVYYGRCVQGNWSGSAAKLQKGGSVLGDEVFMTIVRAGPLFVRASVDEKDSRVLSAGQTCKITTPAFPDAKMSGTVDKIAPVPVGGTFDVRVKLKPTDLGVIPGMSAMIKVVTYEKKDALTLPAAVVHPDDAEDDKYFVYQTINGKPEKTSIKVGKKSGGKVEILDGLKEGDEVLKEKP